MTKRVKSSLEHKTRHKTLKKKLHRQNVTKSYGTDSAAVCQIHTTITNTVALVIRQLADYHY